MNTPFYPIPAWIVMWFIAGVLYLMGKLITFPVLLDKPIKRSRMFGYLFWIGMNPLPWVQKGHRAHPINKPELVRAIFGMASGIALVWGLARFSDDPILAGWCGMVGLVCLLHFGVFHLVAVICQAWGYPVLPIMNRPLAAVALSDFWSHRWNRAFHDLVHPFVFKPVLRRHGATVALFTAFLASGLVHELVISVPAEAGYGLPTLYFLIQAAGILIQRRLGLKSWLFTHAFTALPAVILFHPPFIHRVIIPFLIAIHALP